MWPNNYNYYANQSVQISMNQQNNLMAQNNQNYQNQLNQNYQNYMNQQTQNYFQKRDEYTDQLRKQDEQDKLKKEEDKLKKEIQCNESVESIKMKAPEQMPIYTLVQSDRDLTKNKLSDTFNKPSHPYDYMSSFPLVNENIFARPCVSKELEECIRMNEQLGYEEEKRIKHTYIYIPATVVHDVAKNISKPIKTNPPCLCTEPLLSYSHYDNKKSNPDKNDNLAVKYNTCVSKNNIVVSENISLADLDGSTNKCSGICRII